MQKIREEKFLKLIRKGKWFKVENPISMDYSPETKEITFKRRSKDKKEGD